MSTKRYYAAKKKLAETKAKKTVQHLELGGRAAFLAAGNAPSQGGNQPAPGGGQPSQPPPQNGGTGNPAGGIGSTMGNISGGNFGTVSAASDIGPWFASRDPFSPATSNWTATLPGLINPLTQVGAINQQGISGAPLIAAGQQMMAGGQNSIYNAGRNAAALNSVYAGQQGLAGQLQQQAAGQGPAQQLAQLQLQQAAQQNAQQQAGTIASARGINPALAAQMSQQNTAQANQAAAMQSGQLGLQGQLAAQQQLGNVYGQMGNTQAQAAGIYGQLAGLQTGTGAQLQQAGYNTYLENQGQQLGAFGQYQGAEVGALNGYNSANAEIQKQDLQNRQQNKQAMGGGLLQGLGSVASLAAAHGAVVPGRAKTDGDSPKNDVVDAKLSPGEIVIPRSIAQHPNAPELAAHFVREVLAGRGPKPVYKDGKEGHPDGGDVGDGAGNDGQLITDTEQPQQVTAADLGLSGNISDYSPGYINGLINQKKNEQAAAAKGDEGFAGIPALPIYQGYENTAVGQRDRQSLPGADASPDQVPMASAADYTPKVNPNTTQPPGTVAGAPGSTQAMLDNPFSKAMSAYDQAFGEQRAGIIAGAKAQGQVAADSATASQAFIENADKAAKSYQAGIAQLNTENQQLTQAVLNQQIDPQRFWHNMDTNSKIMASIGIVLAGIGSGMTGQPNMALGIIQKSIDRDIEAQRMELGKKNTLLSMNLQKYGRMDAAYHATMAQYQAMLQGQLQLAAAKQGGPLAAANAQRLLGELDASRAQNLMATGQYMVRGAIGGGALAGPGGAGVNPETLGLADADKKRLVQLPSGGYAFARNEKEAGDTSAALGEMDKLDKNIDAAIDFAKNVGWTAPVGTAAKGTADSLHSNLKLNMTTLEGLNRYSKEEGDLFSGMVPDLGGLTGGIRSHAAITQLQQLKKYNQYKRQSELNRLELPRQPNYSDSFQPVGGK